MEKKLIPMINSILEFLENLLDGFIEIILSLLDEKKHELETDFEDESKVISKRNNGEAVVVNGLKSIDRMTAFENVFLASSTGGGKGVNIIIPTALHLDNASCVINDPGGTVYETTAGKFEEKGFKIILIDLEKAHQSSKYNPLKHVKTSQDIQSIAHILVGASMGNKNSDPFWRLASESLISMLIALSQDLPEHLRHLANIQHMLETLSHSGARFDKFVAQVCSSEKTFSQYKSFITQSEKLNSSIIANTKACLKLFEMDNLASIMMENDIDFSKLRKEKTVIYIKSNVAHQSLYAPILSIFFTQLFEFIFSAIPKEEELPIFMLLDEMSSMYISGFSAYLSNVRKHKCSVLHSWQSTAQLKEKYKDSADAILANSKTQIYIPGAMDFMSAKALSDRMGEYEWEDAKGRRSKRKLMHPQELIQMEPNNGVLLVGHHRPVKLKMKPFYKQRKLLKWSQLEVPERIQGESSGIPLFDFKQI